ncbi:alpha/beta hydrolase [Algibacter aquimarinus]|uniref:Alpha/beta fold hydrolase n=1 Tax=Algibacter aquimarinus TaxID=1136748 RepID=A0ABP9HDZ2_9FLAO
MIIKKGYIIDGKHEKPILIDVSFNPENKNQPLIIFCHGYKGFKDWGAWNLMANTFAKNNICFVKFNFSHNGGTITQPIDFPDLEAFGNNNYTKELDDLESVINWVFENNDFESTINFNNIVLIGHSRAGGIVSIKSEEDNRINKVITLAGVSSFGKRTSTTGDLEKWKKDGVKYVLNGRTKQQMPHYYQFYEDFVNNEQRLTIKRAVSHLEIPHLIIHGDNDTSVFIDEANNLNKWNTKSDLVIIKEADHVFNAKHPWNSNELPKKLEEVVLACLAFIE